MNSSEWKPTKWGDLATLEYGKSLRDYETRSGDIPVYGTNGLIGYTDKPLCPFPSIIIGRKGAYRGIHYSSKPFFVIDTAFYLKPKADNVDLLFAYYQLLTQDINSMDSGSAIPSTSREDFYNLEINLPPISVQRRIADILSTLDEKIELNRQTNATLEDIAQSIFREWFVDGEDVDDWEVGNLGDIAENIRRSVQPSEIEPDTPYIGLEHMPRKSIALSEWDTASDVMSNKYQFKQDEFLFGKLRPYFHKVGVAPLDGVSSTDILVVAPKEDDYYGVVLGHISSVDLINHTTAASTGTKMPRTNWSDIARYEIALPPKERAKQFSGFMKSVVQLIQSNIMEARTLANIRDTLLPKLMNGEIVT